MGKVLIIKGADFSANAIDHAGDGIIFNVSGGIAELVYSNLYNCYYTTDGTTPTTDSTMYTSPFIVTPGTTIKAILQNIESGTLSSVYTYQYAGQIVTIGDPTNYTGTTGYSLATGVALRLFDGAPSNGFVREITFAASQNLYLHVGMLDQEGNFISRAAYPFHSVANTPVDLSSQNIAIHTGEIVVITTGADYQTSYNGRITMEFIYGTISNVCGVTSQSQGRLADRADRVCFTFHYKIEY